MRDREILSSWMGFWQELARIDSQPSVTEGGWRCDG